MELANTARVLVKKHSYTFSTYADKFPSKWYVYLNLFFFPLGTNFRKKKNYIASFSNEITRWRKKK